MKTEEEIAINHTKVLTIENWGDAELEVTPIALGLPSFIFSTFFTEVITDNKTIFNRVWGNVKKVTLLSEDDFIEELIKFKDAKESNTVFMTLVDKDLTIIAEIIGKSADELRT